MGGLPGKQGKGVKSLFQLLFRSKPTKQDSQASLHTIGIEGQSNASMRQRKFAVAFGVAKCL